jgi:hypothetical protein
MRTVLSVLLSILGLVSAVAVVGAEPPVRAADLPRAFSGTFVWRDSGRSYDVTLKIERVVETNGTIRFTGTHDYDRGATIMRVEGEIEPGKRSLKLREASAAGPFAGYAETEGAFAGTVSADLKSLEAEWTTRGTGRKGDLRLQAGSGR